MNLDNYEDVDTRIHAFYADNPNGRITTRLEHYYTDDSGALVSCVVSASVYRAEGTEVAATGLAQEHRSERGVNAVFALEAGETSAIGRALANLGYSTKGARPSRQEMEKAAAVAAPKTGSGGDVGATRSPSGPTAPAPSPSPSMGEAIGNVIEAMPGTRILEQSDTPRPEGRPATEKQIGAIRALMRQTGIKSAEAAGSLILEVVKRPVRSAEDLTSKEASAVIDALKVLDAQQANTAALEAKESPWAEEPGW